MSDIRTVSSNAQTTSSSLAPEDVVSKPTSSGPRPCCVCKDEKAVRDECMLFSEKGEEDCMGTISAYKACMSGFGFKV